MSYSPAPGTTPARILEHMLGQPRTTRFTCVELGDAVDVPSSSVGAFVASLLKHGLVAAEQDPTHARRNLYRIGDPRAKTAAADEQDEDAPVRRQLNAKDAPIAKPGPSSVFDHGLAMPPPSAAPTPFKNWLGRKAQQEQTAAAPAPPPMTKPPAAKHKKANGVVVRVPRPAVARIEPQTLPPDLSCALFNTGDLLIEAPGQQPLRLTSRQCGDLVAYLQRIQLGARATTTPSEIE